MQSLKDIYPEFAGRVDFYVVNQNGADTIEDVVKFGEDRGWTFPAAQPGQGMLSSLRVTQQSIKIAFGGDGVIVYRDGFSGGNAGNWTQVFQDLGG